MSPLRCLFRHIAPAALLLLGALAIAQEYPSRLIRIVVPFPAGGSTDIYARIIANDLQTTFGLSVIIDNRAGGTGIIGAQSVRQAQPDGHTLLFTSNTGHVLGSLLQEPRPFDAVGDFTPIAVAIRFPNYLVINPAIPARTLAEFVAYAKLRPKKLNYSSSGQGSYSHIAGEILNAAAGIDAVHLPYKGAAPALQAVIGGEAQFRFDNVGTSQPFVVAGKLRGLAVTGVKRAQAIADIPTMTEAGINGFDGVYTWLGLLGPAHLPPAIVSRLSAEVARIMHLPEIAKRVLNDGYEVVESTPAQFRNDMQTEMLASMRMIRERGIRAE